MRQEWFDHARFGMFVHFGLYSGAARHEWVQNYERLTDEDYRPYFEHFDPDLFDARALARTAKDTGMGYVVLTTNCLLYTSPSPRDRQKSRMPSSA